MNEATPIFPIRFAKQTIWFSAAFREFVVRFES